MKLRRMVSCMMALLLVCSLPLAAFAEEYDLANGSITVTANTDGQTVNQGGTDHTETSPTVIKQSDSSTPTTNTVTITADAGATAEVTMKDVNIDPGFDGGAAIQTTGEGNVTIELDGSNTVDSGFGHAGVEKNNGGNLTITDENETQGSLKSTGGSHGAGIGGGDDGDGSNITISGSAQVDATGLHGGSGIGGGNGGSGSNIIITDDAKVSASGGTGAAGIGGGKGGSGSNITVSGDAQVKARGGESDVKHTPGAAIGDGAVGDEDPNEVTPDTSKLTPNGKIEYYAPDADMETDTPTKTVTGTYVPPQPEEPVQPVQPEEEAPQIAAPYRVVGQDGKALAFEKQQKGGVLTITVDADFATLTGSASGLKTLKAQGVETIVFVTTGATSTFALADLLAQVPSGSTYALTHVGSTVTLTLSSGMDISSILK